MKRIFFVSAVALLSAVMLFSQSKTTKVGYIDIDEVLRLLSKERTVYYSLLGTEDKTQERIAQLEKEIKVLRVQLAKADTNEEMSLRDKRKIEDDIILKEDELEKWQKEMRSGGLSSADIDHIPRQVKQQVYKALKTVARREGYSLILERYISGVLFVEPDVDITPAVVEELKQMALAKE